ncbi:glycosyltransferase family 4 protein [Robertmurraya beringensis]|uniref:Glycosyltransferase family 4 protein n=1 Tax=Robertmurraya beringensis TaxID=641660 RepID=A0ABV6KRV8_9BACI
MKKKKDILILCQYFYPEYVSSATLPTDLAEDLVDKGLTVDVLCGYPKEYYDGEPVKTKELYKGLTINRVKYTEFNNKSTLGRLINFFSFFISILFKLPYLFKYKSIIVYSNPPILPLIPYFVSCISKTKFVFVAFDIYPDNALKSGSIKKGGIIEKIMNYINKRVYKHASRVVAISNDMKQYMIRENLSLNAGNIDVIPNWYNKDKVEQKKTIGNTEFKKLKEDWPLIVLYSGNMGTLQDMETILECLKLMMNRKDVFFMFTGHGNKAEYVKNYINSNGINNAKVYGFLLGQDYKDVLNIADVCLVSLAEGIEGLGVPSKTYGYLAAGKPVLAIMSDETDIACDLSKYNAGGNVSQGDYKGLERLILNYLNNPKQINTSGINARKLFNERYERVVCTNQYYRMITKVINK